MTGLVATVRVFVSFLMHFSHSVQGTSSARVAGSLESDSRVFRHTNWVHACVVMEKHLDRYICVQEESPFQTHQPKYCEAVPQLFPQHETS